MFVCNLCVLCLVAHGGPRCSTVESTVFKKPIIFKSIILPLIDFGTQQAIRVRPEGSKNEPLQVFLSRNPAYKKSLFYIQTINDSMRQRRVKMLRLGVMCWASGR